MVGIDDKLGQVPVAAVRLRDGATVTPDELVSWSKGRMARYKAPPPDRGGRRAARTGTRKIRRDHLVPLFGRRLAEIWVLSDTPCRFPLVKRKFRRPGRWWRWWWSSSVTDRVAGR